MESDPTIIANKINNLGINAVTNASIDSLLNVVIINEARGRNEIPIGNGQVLNLLDRNECINFYNAIVDNIELQEENDVDIKQKLKKSINNVYKGKEIVPFPEVLRNA